MTTIYLGSPIRAGKTWTYDKYFKNQEIKKMIIEIMKIELAIEMIKPDLCAFQIWESVLNASDLETINPKYFFNLLEEAINKCITEKTIKINPNLNIKVIDQSLNSSLKIDDSYRATLQEMKTEVSFYKRMVNGEWVEPLPGSEAKS